MVLPQQTIVIDTGFDDAEAGRRGRSVTEGLATIGIEAGRVSDVIVTHLHYDHIGGHDQFPAAKFHLQEKEMQFATGPHMCSHVVNASFTPDHIADMVRNVFAGRVSFSDGTAEIAPGITVHHIGGHSMGLQFVRVLTKRGWVVVASETTTRVLASLTPREERVLRMRFGIGMNTDHTLEEVGQQFSVTRERIRQIEAKALRKLKHPSRSRKLRSFLDN